MELDDEASGSKMDICTNGSEETSNWRPIRSGELLNIEAQRNATTQISQQQHMMLEKIALKSSDGEIFEVDEATALQLKSIAHLVKDNHVKQAVTLVNFKGKILSKVIEYCKKHGDADETTDNILKEWDAEFMKVNQSMIFDIVMAANDLEIISLVDLICQTVAGMLRVKTIAEVIATFKKDDMTHPRKKQKSMGF